MRIDKMNRFLGGFLLAFALGTPSQALAQDTQDALIQELFRKAAAREGENGYCARTGWREETPETHDTNIEIWDRGVVGSTKTFIDMPGGGGTPYCGYARILEVYQEAGQRCIRVQLWYCSIGRSCATQSFSGCRNPKTWDWK